MGFMDIALIGLGAVVGSDLAVTYLPATIDVSSIPVRKYAGGVAGGYAAYRLLGHKKPAGAPV